VREIRNNKRLLVDVQGRALVVGDADVTALDTSARRARRAGLATPAPPDTPDAPGSAAASAEIDLHGLTVEEALARADSALNDALLADARSLRLIHGRSGGKIRAALHRRLRELPSVRGFRIDPRNEGVTIVSF
jgi:dsDNA-specific endonuclease/ATPase MutS2